jgi:hypothetical protein
MKSLIVISLVLLNVIIICGQRREIGEKEYQQQVETAIRKTNNISSTIESERNEYGTDGAVTDCTKSKFEQIWSGEPKSRYSQTHPSKSCNLKKEDSDSADSLDSRPAGVPMGVPVDLPGPRYVKKISSQYYHLEGDEEDEIATDIYESEEILEYTRKAVVTVELTTRKYWIGEDGLIRKTEVITELLIPERRILTRTTGNYQYNFEN